MQSLLDQLDNDQAILLMYLANELPVADLARVDERLASQPRLREELEQLRITHGAIQHALGELDASQPLPDAAASAASERVLTRIIHQWHTDRAIAASKALANSTPATRSRMRWLYSAAAAAAIFLGFIIWWGTSTSEEDQQLPPLQNPTAENVVPFGPASRFNPYYYALSQPMADFVGDPQKQALADAEKDLDALNCLRDLTQ